MECFYETQNLKDEPEKKQSISVLRGSGNSLVLIFWIISDRPGKIDKQYLHESLPDHHQGFHLFGFESINQ